MPKKIQLREGQRFGRWTVVKESGVYGKNGTIMWECICDCGNVSAVSGTHLNMGKSGSCGCYQREVATANIVHGATKNGIDTPEYTSWMQMKGRCYNENFKQFSDYGGRGIIVCPRWLGENGFINFLSDMGERPEGHSLDRYPNNNGNYEPSNCRWATRPQQQRGRRNNIWLEHDGEKLVMADWLKRIDMPYSTFHYHVKKGRTIEEINKIVKNKKTAA